MKSVVLFATIALLCTLSTIVMVSAQQCDLSAALTCAASIQNSVSIIKKKLKIGLHITIKIYKLFFACMHVYVLATAMSAACTL